MIELIPSFLNWIWPHYDQIFLWRLKWNFPIHILENCLLKLMRTKVPGATNVYQLFFKRSTPPWLEAFLTTKDNAWSSIIMCQKKVAVKKLANHFSAFPWIFCTSNQSSLQNCFAESFIQCNSVVHFFVTCKPVLLAFWCLHVL